MRPGATVGTSPFKMWISVPQVVVREIFTMASVAAWSEGRGLSYRARLPGPWYTSAFIVRFVIAFSIVAMCAPVIGGSALTGC